jgi:signal transduction histidine kinase
LYRSGNTGAAPTHVGGVAARLDDAARLCGRVGHDFDNVLMGVLGFAELTQTQLDPGSRAAGYVTELLRAANNARAITVQLHAFNHSGDVNRLPTRLADVCGPKGFGLAAEDAARVTIETTLPPDLPPVAIGLVPLQMMIGHVVRNAAEAMPGGGRVTLTARSVSLADGLPDAVPVGLDPGEYVEVTVADAGLGMAPDLAARVGREPFLTTKARHRGLGLPTVFRVLVAHGGGLRIESTPRGTAIVLYLPSAPLVPPTSAWHADTAPLEVSPK